MHSKAISFLQSAFSWDCVGVIKSIPNLEESCNSASFHFDWECMEATLQWCFFRKIRSIPGLYWLIAWCLNPIFKIISVISQLPVHLSMLSWNFFHQSDILSKPLFAFPHNHCHLSMLSWSFLHQSDILSKPRLLSQITIVTYICFPVVSFTSQIFFPSHWLLPHITIVTYLCFPWVSFTSQMFLPSH